MADHHHQFSYSSSSSVTVTITEWDSGLPSDDLTPLPHHRLAPFPRCRLLYCTPSLPRPSLTALTPTSPPSKPFPPSSAAAIPLRWRSYRELPLLRGGFRGILIIRESKEEAGVAPHLHKPFLDMIAPLGSKEVVPKKIMEIMNVEGLTRKHVAIRLQKYQIKLKESSPCN